MSVNSDGQHDIIRREGRGSILTEGEEREMEKRELKVLIIEDLEEDVFLLGKNLEKAGFNPLIRNICTKQALIDALDTGDWDVILSDYTLPEINGLEVLKIKQEKKPEIPFIIVTGTIGEEAAVELLKTGADDYIMKKHLAR